MLKKLRLHLMGVCVLMTSAVFLILMAVICYNSIAQFRQLNGELFDSTVAMITDKLQTEESINDAWLSNAEVSNNCIITVGGNGTPFFFDGAWSPVSDRALLVEQANAAAREHGVDVLLPSPKLSDAVTAEFRLAGSAQDRYRCSVTSFPARGGYWMSLTVLKDMRLEQQALNAEIVRYVFLSVLVMAALIILSWWFSGKAVKPTADSLARQKAFIAAASHELRAPVAVIRTSASAVKVEPAQTDDLLETIDDECASLERLIAELLLMANIDTKTWVVQKNSVDLDTVLLETAERLMPIARQKGFHICLQTPDEILPRVCGDAQRIEQVLLILLNNAMTHSGKAGTIELIALPSGSHIVIKVVDHGVGIPPDERGKVFDRFYSVDKARHHRGNFGLGLSIAAELMQLMNGGISLRETEGGGCTFEMKLPIFRATA